MNNSMDDLVLHFHCVTLDYNKETKKFSINELDKTALIRRISEKARQYFAEKIEDTYEALMGLFYGKKLSKQIYTHNDRGELIAITSPTRKINKSTIKKIVEVFRKNDFEMERCQERSDLIEILTILKVHYHVAFDPLRTIEKALDNPNDVDIGLLWYDGHFEIRNNYLNI